MESMLWVVHRGGKFARAPLFVSAAAKYIIMRFREFLLLEQQLDELKMNPKSLQAFAHSDQAQGIRAGFEAELIFPELGGPDPDGGEWEPDWNEDRPAHNIDDIIDFFRYDEHGLGISRWDAQQWKENLDQDYVEYLEDTMREKFYEKQEQLIKEYLVNNEFDVEDRMRTWLSKQGIEDVDAVMTARHSSELFTRGWDLVQDQLEDEVAFSITDADDVYQTVLDEFREEFFKTTHIEEKDYLEHQGFRWMSDVAEFYNMVWPYVVQAEGDNSHFDHDNAQRLASDLSEQLGYTTTVSSSYHSAPRDDVTWIFEPDSSIDADPGDMPVEIVSPPMPLTETLQALNDFFAWAQSHDAYSNRSTGFHMSVSLPKVGGRVDFVKLALFLGDQYVLQSFGRAAVIYCQSAIKKIKERIDRGSSDKITDAMAAMRTGLNNVARNSIADDRGFGKYTSINPKDKYIEFRSAGGSNYFGDIDRLQNMLLRYARAMTVAADPQAERRAYHKKLYKLIAPAGDLTSLDLFAQYAAGVISRDALKRQWAAAELTTTRAQSTQVSDWIVLDRGSGQPLPEYQYNNMTRDQAYAEFKQQISPNSSQPLFDEFFERQYELVDARQHRRMLLAKRISSKGSS